MGLCPPRGQRGHYHSHLPTSGHVVIVRCLDTSGLWRAAARAAHINGDHAAEFRYRDQARLIEGLPPLTSKARCLPS